MSDSIDISYSLGSGSEATQVVEADLYAVADFENLPLPSGNLLINNATGASMLAMPQMALVLQYCTRFRSLAQHAQYLAAALPDLVGEDVDIVSVLESVKEAGLMISARDLCEQLKTEEHQPPELVPSDVFVITCDRPRAVERLLESMLKGAALSRHRRLFLVDDSRDVENVRLNREEAERFSVISPVKMHYIGVEEQRRLLAELIAAMPQAEEGIRFLIDRERWAGQASYGLARTLCLLLSVDARCIVMDDDVICTALASPNRSAGPAFVDSAREAQVYGNPQQWQQTAQTCPHDPLVGHLECLGLTASAAMSRLGLGDPTQEHFNEASGALYETVNNSTPVLITQSGTFGDPGTSGNSWLTQLGPASVQRMLAAEDGLHTAFVSRQCWLGQHRPSFTRRSALSQVTGLDNTHVLPPYFPVLRGEDELFGAMTQILYPDSLALEYDWAVPHEPLEYRQGNPRGDSATAKPGLHLCSSYLLSRCSSSVNAGFHSRLNTLCTAWEEVAGSDEHVLESLYKRRMGRAQALGIQSLSDRLAETVPEAEDWVAYLQREVGEAYDALQLPVSLADIGPVDDNEDAAAVASQLKSYAGSYAAALRAWPQLRAAAQEITERLIA